MLCNKSTKIDANIYKIYWECTLTGKTGESKEPMTRLVAESWVNELKKRHPEMKHIMKKV